jgi:hypothetical protein
MQKAADAKQHLISQCKQGFREFFPATRMGILRTAPGFPHRLDLGRVRISAPVHNVMGGIPTKSDLFDDWRT